MDSLTQAALGAAVGVAVLGRRAGPKAALWGAACGTLPDLDVLVPYADPVADFTFHRAESHAFFYLTLASPLIAWLIAKIHRDSANLGRWTLLVWLALVTHALLDAFTVYGTQLLLPFSDYPVGLGSVFIIDPLYTVPLLIGVSVALALGRTRPDVARRSNTVGLALSSLYLAWSVGAQSHVEGLLHRSLAASSLEDGRVLVTPTPFNTLLWRVVVMDDDGYHEGFHSLLDGQGDIALTRHASQAGLLSSLRDEWNVQRLAWFSKGFYGVSVAPPDANVAIGAASTLGQLLGAVPMASAAGPEGGDTRPRVVMSDLRMGQTPFFVFSFIVGAADGSTVSALPTLQLPTSRPPVGEALGWVWRRIWDEAAGPPPASR